MQREERAQKKARVNNPGSGNQHSIFKKRANELAAAKKRMQG
jgi:hypothetical protein